MSLLIDSIQIASRFQKSIRIDSDIQDASSLDGFICPQSSANALSLMAETVSESGHGAFTWTGPYGSGKSSLVVALSAILSSKENFITAANTAVGKDLVRQIRTLLPPRKDGWTVLPTVGRRANPAKLILESLIDNGLSENPDQSEEIERYVIDQLLKAAHSSAKTSGGLIVFIDEMGKCLEEAGNTSQDIYFFQQLAEAASRSKKRLIIVGILHQSFGEYASRLSREARDEWTKIQGRFVDLPINTVGEEQIDLISRAIQSAHTHKSSEKPAKIAFKLIKKNQPSASEEMMSKLAQCWPLHPVVACLLGPISKRRFGQNQRSIFGFLNSPEPQGFQDYLKNNRLKGHQLYSTAALFDYLRINLEPSILASPDGHRWALAVEAIERCDSLGGDAFHIETAKTIALIDLFKNRSGVVANLDFLTLCSSTKSVEKVQLVLDDLQKWSIIIFKKYLDSFAIYAGSDFDIDQALNEFDVEQKVDFKKLRSIAQLQPILAKRYYHSTGSMCWFDTDISPVSEALQRVENISPSSGAIGQFILLIPTEGESKDEIDNICRSAVATSEGWPSLLGLAQNSWYVESLAKELIALEHIRVERPELEGDAVARREVDARIAATSSLLEEELKKSFSGAQWYRKGVEPHSVGHAGLSFLASMLARDIFPQAPCIHNELLNRIKPSSSAIAGQKNLLRLMVSKEGTERLGIEGYPAEGGLFESLLNNTGLYRLDPESKTYRFLPPTKNNKAKLSPLWAAARKFVSQATKQSISLQDIYDIWVEKFGVRQGLLPIIGVAFILSNRNQFALYLDGIFRSSFDDYVIDCLTQDANRLQLRWMDLSDVSRQILSGMADLVSEIDESNQQVELEPVEVAKRLVSIVDGLPLWTLRTNKVSKNARKVRELFKKAHDPNKFLFDDIPGLFNAETDHQEGFSPDQVISQVKEGIIELKNIYPNMLNNLKNKMLKELNVEDNVDSLTRLRSRGENIKEITGNFRLDAFINRVTSFNGQLDEIEGIASLAANKPPRDWIDRDIDQATIEIADLAQQFNRVEGFARVSGRTDKSHAVAVVVGFDGGPKLNWEQFHISDQDKSGVDALVSRFQKIIEEDKIPKNLALAAMAEMSNKFMGSPDE